MSEQNYLTDERATFYAKKFTDVYQLLPQDKGSKLRPFVTVQGGLVGEGAVAANQIGETTVNEVTEKYQDSPHNEVSTARRWFVPRTYDWGTLFEKIDKIQTLGDPENMYAMAAKKAFGRNEDDRIIEAFYGANATGKDGQSSTDFDANNIIAADNTGLTVAKLISAWELLQHNEIDLDIEAPTMIITSKQATNLMNDAKYVNRDYGEVVLDNGRLKPFMGFNFIVKENLPIASSIRKCPVFVKSCLALGEWDNLTVELSKRADKKYLPYLYMRQSIGATRLNEKGCVSIECKE